MNGDQQITHAVLAERLDNLKEDVHELKDSMRYMSRSLVGLVVSLLLIGAGAILTVVLNFAT